MRTAQTKASFRAGDAGCLLRSVSLPSLISPFPEAAGDVFILMFKGDVAMDGITLIRLLGALNKAHWHTLLEPVFIRPRMLK